MRRWRWIAGLAAVACGVAALALTGAHWMTGTTGEEFSVSIRDEEIGVSVRNELLPGPAAAAPGAPADTAGAGPSGSPNRLGSAAVPVRVYEPQGQAPWATLVWAHGGSFVRGTLDWPEADWVARAFAEAGMRVYSVDYALASDSVKAPAPANDLAAVVRAVAVRHEGLLVVGGASAGAHLAALAALAQADWAGSEPQPGGTGGAADSPTPARSVDALLMLYPTAHRVQREDPQIAALTAVLPEARRFDSARIAEMYAYYLGDTRPGRSESHEHRVDPPAYPDAPTVVGELPPERLRQLPPTIIINADADDLRASGEHFAEQLTAAGVRVTLTLQPGTLHGYLNRPEESDRARADARATIDRFVTEVRAIHPE
ncbi:alpha/beta hydrolase [Leucobacter sp. Z1108]|uniref:alpha/beta hydrolase n=1 Tax=Leucobacter sp. Z1108 TaxID=3439066 RepID=UPI003F38C732